MKIIAMSTISNVADITHSWSEITIWYLAENHVLIVTGSMPALRPFWRAVSGKLGSYRTSSYDKDASGSNKKQSGGSIHMPTIGSIRYNARKGPVPGPYSVELPGDSSEESLEKHLRGNNHSPKMNKWADTESVEVILPKHHGSTKATITGGQQGEGDEQQKRIRRRDSDGKITVTTEYQVQ
jgi:hypothetical protein